LTLGRRDGESPRRQIEREWIEKKGGDDEGGGTQGLVEEPGGGKEGGGGGGGPGGAGDFLRRLKSGILRLGLGEGSEEEGREECWRPRKRSESSEVLLRSLAEAVEGREGVAM